MYPRNIAQNLLEATINAQPQMMLQIHPNKNIQTVNSCSHPIQKLRQKHPTLPPADNPTLAQQKTLNEAVIVPGIIIATMISIRLQDKENWHHTESWENEVYNTTEHRKRHRHYRNGSAQVIICRWIGCSCHLWDVDLLTLCIRCIIPSLTYFPLSWRWWRYVWLALREKGNLENTI